MFRWLVAFALVAASFTAACSAAADSSNASGSAVQEIAAQPASTVAPASRATPVATVTSEASAKPHPPTVVIDPGHAVDEIGAAAHGVIEKDSNLEMAFRVEALLVEAGIRVVLTRRADVRANAGPPVAGYSATRLDLQARIDLANAEAADLFVSIHSNGSGSAAEQGIEAYYNASRPFSDENRALAELLVTSVVEELATAGYPTRNRGAIDDRCLRAFQGRCFPLFVLGPGRETTRDEVLRRDGDPAALGFAPGEQSIVSRPTQMPGALIELLFISNPADAALLQVEAARAAMARGIVRAILAYFTHASAGAE
jgi:N-acetylmuramoyl-L-alanine amidase